MAPELADRALPRCPAVSEDEYFCEEVCFLSPERIVPSVGPIIILTRSCPTSVTRTLLRILAPRTTSSFASFTLPGCHARCPVLPISSTGDLCTACRHTSVIWYCAFSGRLQHDLPLSGEPYSCFDRRVSAARIGLVLRLCRHHCCCQQAYALTLPNCADADHVAAYLPQSACCHDKYDD